MAYRSVVFRGCYQMCGVAKFCINTERRVYLMNILKVIRVYYTYIRTYLDIVKAGCSYQSQLKVNLRKLIQISVFFVNKDKPIIKKRCPCGNNKTKFNTTSLHSFRQCHFVISV